MIIIPQAFLLSQDTAAPLTHSRIGYQTFTRGALASQVTVSSQTATGPADAPLRPDTYEFWQASAIPATWQINLGSVKDIDYVGIAGHTIGTAGGAIKVEYSINGTDWVLFSSEVAPANDAPLLFLDEEVSALHVRLTLSLSAIAPQIAVIYIGKALAMQRAIYGSHTPITMSRETVLKRALSRGGRFLGQNYMRSGVKTDASFRNLKADWIRSDFDPFVLSARRFPYFFGWRPQTYPNEVGFVWTNDDIVPSNQGQRDFMQVSWSMKGIGHGD
jgi:hypothetical protein